MRATAYLRRVAPAIALAALWCAAPAFAQAAGQSCAEIAASRWEAGHEAATREFEDFDAVEVIATCEPALAAAPTDSRIKAWLGHAYLHEGRDAEAVKLLRESARARNPVAQMAMADVYSSGRGVAIDRQQALTMLTASAGQGFAPAQLALGEAFRLGESVAPKNIAKAREWYDKAAERGMAVAQSRLGDTYYFDMGDGTKPDYALAYRHYFLAANQKDRDGLYGLGLLHDLGLGVAVDRAKALDYLTQAADLGHVKALGDLGAAYLNGADLVEVDHAKALDYLERGAELGDAFSLTNLAFMYQNGLGTAQDYARAASLYERAASQGELAAADALGNLYLEGIGVEADFSRALGYALRAAEGGYADSQNRVGYILAEGLGVERDSPLALEWFRKAADQGHELAITNVAELEAEAACAAAAASQYEPQFGSIGRDLEAIDAAIAIPACEAAVATDPGSDEDKAWLARAYLAAGRYEEARPLLDTAAAGDSRLAQFLLGQLLNGDFGGDFGGDDADHAAANTLFQAAAEAGFAPAQLSLGHAYDVGNGVDTDDAAAARWYLQAAEQGLAGAQASLGYLYHGGNGVPLDYARAMEWYAKAAEQGEGAGIYGVGQLYEFGQGVEQDYGQAFQYFQRGADLGDSFAQADLGYLYDMGYGVAEDPVQAAYWYQRAADQNYALAQANLAQLYTAGRGVVQDYQLALELYTRAHEQGEVSGTVGLAQAYLYAEGVEPDYAQARAYAQQAVDKDSVYGMGTLGYIYAEGYGVPRDFDRAIELFDQAAAQGDQYGTDRAAEARAERACGLTAAAVYEAGYETTGKPVSGIEATAAVPVCEEAVRLDPSSLEDKTWLARAYLAADRGEEAVPLFEAAIAGSWDPALVEFGDVLLLGRGVPADPARAFGLYTEAASRNFAAAEFGLGFSYQIGLGVPADFNAAEKWFSRALAHGYASAQISLDDLAHTRARPVFGPQRALPKG